MHSNVWAGAHLSATYDQPSGGVQAVHFHLSDPLGTRRVQTNYQGVAEMSYQSLPFGDGFTSTANPNCKAASNCYADDPTENHFTGKERDTESGNDYFEARYYSSAVARFMSPDWSAKVEPIPYSKLDNPQSLNLYAYVTNNPLGGLDPDGHAQSQDAPDQSNGDEEWMKSRHPELANAMAESEWVSSGSISWGQVDAADLAHDKATGLRLFPTRVKNDSVMYRLRTADGKHSPRGRYVIYEHQTQPMDKLLHVGKDDNISPRNSKEADDVARNSFPDELGGGGLNTFQSFTFSTKNIYDSSAQNSVLIRYGDGTDYAGQGIYQNSWKDPVLINGKPLSQMPQALPETVDGEY